MGQQLEFSSPDLRAQRAQIFSSAVISSSPYGRRSWNATKEMSELPSKANASGKDWVEVERGAQRAPGCCQEGIPESPGRHSGNISGAAKGCWEAVEIKRRLKGRAEGICVNGSGEKQRLSMQDLNPQRPGEGKTRAFFFFLQHFSRCLASRDG